MARLLNALETEGAIEQDQAGGEYRLGPAIEEIAGGSSQGRSLIAAAQPFLVDLSEQTEEASGLDILEGRQVHFMDMVESGQDVQVRDWTGEDWAQPTRSPQALPSSPTSSDAPTFRHTSMVGSKR